MNDARLPSVITTYDILKTLAVVSMICDHLGYYFFPENLWWRALTLSAPVWFFLIGYAKSRDLSLPLWAGCALLALGSALTGEAVFPLSVLATMIVYRVILDSVMDGMNKSPQALYVFAVIAGVMTLLTCIVFEYGMSGFVFAMLGYLVRNREALQIPRARIVCFAFFSWIVFTALQLLLFFPDFSPSQKWISSGGFFFVTLYLMSFRPDVWPRLTGILPKAATSFLQFCGRYSLWIYVSHLLVFKVVAAATGATNHEFFNFHIID